ncbi:hypothetical protein HK102_005689 [Quaeritorhiza haematococci]|nr:hypothetical protein HK102_005689 [Quaeritorhiza haematococci]
MALHLHAVASTAALIDLAFTDQDLKTFGLTLNDPANNSIFLKIVSDLILIRLGQGNILRGAPSEYTINVTLQEPSDVSIRSYIREGRFVEFEVLRRGQNVPLTTAEQEMKKAQLRLEIEVAQQQRQTKEYEKWVKEIARLKAEKVRVAEERAQAAEAHARAEQKRAEAHEAQYKLVEEQIGLYVQKFKLCQPEFVKKLTQ